MKEYAKELYNDINTICDTAVVKKSGKQLKWDIYRAIKQKVSFYKMQAEEERKKAGYSGAFNRPTQDEIKIHLLGSMVVKNQFTDAMSCEEFIGYIKDVTAMCMNNGGITNGQTSN